MGEASRHDRNRHAGIEHLGGHEVSEIMETKMAKASGPTSNDEALGDEVRQPGSGSCSVGTEHKALFERICSVLLPHMFTVGPQEFDAGGVERDPVRTTGLGGNEDRSFRPLDDRASSRGFGHEVESVERARSCPGGRRWWRPA